MSSLIQFPFVRLQYPIIGNPLFAGDIVAANQQVLDAITAICGLGATDFAIFSGFTYHVAVSGANTYSGGIFYLNGVWYYQPNTFNEAQYLSPNPQGILPEVFEDSSVNDIYQVNQSVAGSVSIPGTTSPQFMGSMSAYRMDMKTIFNIVNLLQFQTTVQNLQVASFPTNYTIDFRNDKAIFFYTSPTGTHNITFDFTGAVPGTVIRVKFTFPAATTINVNQPGGTVAYLESGTMSSAAGRTNIMYFLYAGLNELNENEVSYNITQI